MIGLKIVLLTISYKGLQGLAYIQDALFTLFKRINLYLYESLLKGASSLHCKALLLKSRPKGKMEEYNSFEEVE